MSGVVERAGAVVAPDRPSTAAAAAAVVAPTVRRANQPVQVPGNPNGGTDTAFTFVIDTTVPNGTSTLSAPVDAAAVARNVAGPTDDGFHLRVSRRFHLVEAFGDAGSGVTITIGASGVGGGLCFPTADGAVIDGPGSFTVDVLNTTGSDAPVSTQFAAFPLSDL